MTSNRKNTTIHDIAAAANKSASTVSRALHDSSRISLVTKRKIRLIAEELNYRPNHIASSLRTGKGKTIGVVVPQINWHFFANVINGIENILNKEGYNIIICQSDESVEKEKASIKTLINNRVDGVLISVSRKTTDDQNLQLLNKAGITVIQFDRTIENIGHMIINDDYCGGRMATNHLISQGYKRIGHLSGPMSLNIYKERRRGYESALAENNMPLIKENIYEISTPDKSFEMAKSLITSNHPPDAIFCAGDYMSVAVLKAAREIGLSSPVDLGIVGYANEPFTEFTSPTLSSVDQQSVELGKGAANILLQELGRSVSKKKITFTTTKLTPKLMVRGSSVR